MTSSPISPSRADVWTTRRLLDWMGGHFRDRKIDSPRVVAEMLLSHVIGCERLRLYMEVDRPASADELARLRALVREAADHAPVQYLVGEAWFFGRPFEVDRSTLIPRPSTETLVEQILRWAAQTDGPVRSIADIGTGTGCVAVAVAAQLPAVDVVATDVKPEAVALAGRNARRHGVEDRCDLRVGSLFEPIAASPPAEPFDVIGSNPPYIPDSEWAEVPENVRLHEPETALRGGADGLDVIRPLIAEAGRWLRPGGLLAVEVAHVHRDDVLRLATEAGFCGPRVVKDHEGLWRVLVAEKGPES